MSNSHKKKITLREILMAIGIFIPTFFILAIFNISNEDLYNNDLETIFNQGSFMDKTAFILFWIWFIVVFLWSLNAIYLLMKQLKTIIKNSTSMANKTKIHSTNYFNTFIEVAEDSKSTKGTVPPRKGDKKTVAVMQYELISKNPYKFTSDDVFFQVFAERNDLTKLELVEARVKFFSKGQPCFRASPLTKSYGFGIHSDEEGKVALYGMESDEYQKYFAEDKIKKVKAMRSSRK